MKPLFIASLLALSLATQGAAGIGGIDLPRLQFPPTTVPAPQPPDGSLAP